MSRRPSGRHPRPAVFAAALTLLVCCAGGHADPFGPVPTSDAFAGHTMSSVSSSQYRAVGVATNLTPEDERAAAVIQTPGGGFHVVRTGEQVGNATVTSITLDAVHLKMPQAELRLPVGD